jgi:hypothetical protein
MRKSVIQVIISVSLILMIACKEEKKSLSFEEFRTKTAEIMDGINTPGDIAVILELSDAEYLPGLVNDPESYKHYIKDTLHAAANLGVYLVDATYQYTYMKGDGAYKSYAAAKKLSEVIGLQDILWDITFKRHTEGLTQEDSVLVKLEKVLTNAENAFSDFDRHRMYTIIIAGNYFEKLYLLMNILLEGNKDLPDEVRLQVSRQIIIAIRAQLAKTDNLIALIEQYKTEDDPGFVIEQLYDIRTIRKKFYKSEDISKLTPDAIYNNPAVKNLFSYVKSIRNHIISKN